jgi:cell cycle related kinase
VKLRQVFPAGTGVVLVFEFMLSDLAEVLKSSAFPLSECQIKAYMVMLLKGIEFCHKNHIMHRDLKPASMLRGFHIRFIDFAQSCPEVS